MFERLSAARANGRGHRTSAPLRRNSGLKGNCEAGFWKATKRLDAKRILLAAKRYEVANKEPGKRTGPLGAVAIEVLELLVNLVDFKSGRLEPSISTMMNKLRRSRDAIVRALNALRSHGFVDWLRRYVPTNNDGAGPQVQQTSNAYRLNMPKRAEEALGKYGKPSPVPEDRAQADLERLQAEARHALETHSLEGLRALAELQTFAGRQAEMFLSLLNERESAKQTEPESRYLL
ncbi:helix-turn-helix domain-containing protein [Rhizobium rhizoryzae]|uniref:Helix-turn-helix domain-containing protein n=1 Tax=Rhizobium rhizoryzae TaxID=451876 RepID=A0A7W6LMA7_9HYPH|nr:helix-turn-helix domain-containing protein [Rhizobium rhizoryzae]MBB4145852.1 hypothetical protein [Rhizobium rhizoryzae]